MRHRGVDLKAIQPILVSHASICKRDTHVRWGIEKKESVDRAREEKEKEIEYAEVELKLT